MSKKKKATQSGPQINFNDILNKNKISEIRKWINYLQQDKQTGLVYSQLNRQYGNDKNYYRLFKLCAITQVNLEQSVSEINYSIEDWSVNKLHIHLFTRDMKHIWTDIALKLKESDTELWESLILKKKMSLLTPDTRGWWNRFCYYKKWIHHAPFKIFKFNEFQLNSKKLSLVCFIIILYIYINY